MSNDSKPTCPYQHAPSAAEAAQTQRDLSTTPAQRHGDAPVLSLFSFIFSLTLFTISFLFILYISGVLRPTCGLFFDPLVVSVVLSGSDFDPLVISPFKLN